jgi:hypothetical protein
LSQEAARGGGTYTVYYGAIIVGILFVIGGVYGMVTGREVS